MIKDETARLLHISREQIQAAMCAGSAAEYRHKLLDGNQNVILARGDALCIRGYGSFNTYRGITVYSQVPINDAEFESIIVIDLESVSHEIYKNLCVCTVEKAFIDLLDNVKGDEQILIEALGDYYYAHGESFETLHIPDRYMEQFEKYKEDAIQYWSY